MKPVWSPSLDPTSGLKAPVRFKLDRLCRAGFQILLCMTFAGSVSFAAKASERASCLQPRLSDVGWTDITITTSLTAQVLEGLGYKPQIHMLGTDITYQGMKNGDIDIFLGTWLPGLQEVSEPFYADGSIEKVRTNLTGAKFTLAVPKYVSDSGVSSFNDLRKYKERFGGKIFGLESGGNKPIEEMIEKNDFDLGSWQLVESSEAGMLSQVEKAISSGEWIVFLGWAPHPMNRKYEITYLSGGDAYYGKDYGAAIVNTDVRKGYGIECPNISALLTNLEFSIEMENALMESVLGKGMPPQDAARKWLKENPKWLERTLTGTTDAIGKPGLARVRAYLGLE